MQRPDTLNIWRADVLRWHCHPDRRLRLSGDTTQAHSLRMIQLLWCLCPEAPSAALLGTAAFHDTGESGVGDVSGPAMHKDPVLSAATKAAEARSRADLGVPVFALTPEEEDWLHLVDRLDAYLWMLHVAPDLRVRFGWGAAARRIIATATSLGCGDTVFKLIADADLQTRPEATHD